jgi:hypothetical protein
MRLGGLPKQPIRQGISSSTIGEVSMAMKQELSRLPENGSICNS